VEREVENGVKRCVDYAYLNVDYKETRYEFNFNFLNREALDIVYTEMKENIDNWNPADDNRDRLIRC
jgi:hypothetical protein